MVGSVEISITITMENIPEKVEECGIFLKLRIKFLHHEELIEFYTGMQIVLPKIY